MHAGIDRWIAVCVCVFRTGTHTYSTHIYIHKEVHTARMNACLHAYFVMDMQSCTMFNSDIYAQMCMHTCFPKLRTAYTHAFILTHMHTD